MARNVTKYSDRGQPWGQGVDADALTLRARQRTVVYPVIISSAAGRTATAMFTQNSTVKHNLGPVGAVATLRAAYISQTTLAAGGTLSWKLVAYDASGNAEVVLTTTLDPEAGTVREAQTFALDTTNVELAADDTLELHCVADNNTVTQDAKGVVVTAVWETSESSTPQVRT